MSPWAPSRRAASRRAAGVFRPAATRRARIRPWPTMTEPPGAVRRPAVTLVGMRQCVSDDGSPLGRAARSAGVAGRSAVERLHAHDGHVLSFAAEFRRCLLSCQLAVVESQQRRNGRIGVLGHVAGSPVAARVGGRLAVAVGAEKAQVIRTVVQEVAVVVVHVQGERQPVPFRPQTARCATVGYSPLPQRPREPKSRRTPGSDRQAHEELLRRAPVGSDGTSVVCATGEVPSVDAEPLQLPADVSMCAAVPSDPESAQHLRDAVGLRRCLGQQLRRVLVASHPGNVSGGYDRTGAEAEADTATAAASRICAA
jgi:hypothetical protein